MDLIVNQTTNITNGQIPISGAKNSAVAIIPACLLSNDTVTINNVPDILDVKYIIEILNEMGHYAYYSNNTVTVKRNNNASYIFSNNIDKLRGSYYFIGVYLAYFKKIGFKSCGGCDLGNRPTNYHFSAFQEMGVNLKVINNINILETSCLIGKTIKLPKPSVGATINIMLASSNAFGKTVIKNAAKEPEIVDVGNFLMSMGLKITGLGSSKITIYPNALHGCTYSVMSDRIEAGTYLTIGTLFANTPITVYNINPKYLKAYLKCLKKMGHNIQTTTNSITLTQGTNLKSIKTKSHYYPSLPTDLGPILTIPLSLLPGTSEFTETIFDNRFSHVKELIKLNANIKIINNKLIIKGNTKYHNGEVTAHDLRCASSLLLAAIKINNNTIIHNAELLFRGYENLIKKLQEIGINCSLIVK